MYVDMEVGEAGAGDGVMIPRAAVQMVGDRTVVYLANPATPGRYVERVVKLGDASGDLVHVISGLVAGDAVVSKGSFSIRAERERVGAGGAAPVATSGVQTARVIVSEKGYEPARVTLRAAVPARITFVRTTDATCGMAVTIPSLSLRRALPLNQPVEIEFTPQKAGDVEFVCGTGMLKGRIVVQ
jgi:hypothetical protein